MPPERSVAKVLELQRYLHFRLSQQRDGCLQIVALLAADAQRIAVDLRLDLQARGLELRNEFLGGGLIDALLDGDPAPRLRQIHLDLAQLQAAQVDAPRRQAQSQDVQQLFELIVILRELRDDEALELKARTRAAQVIAFLELPARLIHRIGELVYVDLGDRIKGGHARKSAMAGPIGPALVADAPGRDDPTQGYMAGQ